MEPISFHKKNVFGIEVGSAPYVSIILNKAKSDEIAHKEITIYQHEGKQLFEMKDNLGNPTGEMVFFVVFR